jgi:hypothetical protein
MDFRFTRNEQVRVVDDRSHYFDLCSAVAACKVSQSNQAPMYQLFGSIWFMEYQLERASY